MQDQSSPDFTFPRLRKRSQPSALLTCDVGSLAKYLTPKLKRGSICLGLRSKVGSVCQSVMAGKAWQRVALVYSLESSAHISAKQKTKQLGQKYNWLINPKACPPVMCEAPPPKGFTISQNSATSWGPCTQKHEPREDILHQNRTGFSFPHPMSGAFLYCQDAWRCSGFNVSSHCT